MAAPRPVRIPRGRPGPTPSPATERPSSATEVRANTAGSQRAFRFAILYVFALMVLDGVLVGLDLSQSDANRPGIVADLQLFLAIAIVLAVGSVVFALTPAPRRIELASDRTVVVGRWGRRRVYPPLEELAPKVLRHYHAGFLSSDPVDMVRLTDRDGRSGTYQLQSGLLDPPIV